MNDVQSVVTSRGPPTGIASRDINETQMVKLDRRFLLLTVVATLLLSWPLLVFGHPSYFQDSVAYYKGGRAALNYVAENLDLPNHSTTATRPIQTTASRSAATEITGNEVKGARSVTYSVAA